MSYYKVRYVHKISPSPADVLPDPIRLGTADLADRKTLAALLRSTKVLGKGDRIDAFRKEVSRIAVFPQASIWHAIILEYWGDEP